MKAFVGFAIVALGLMGCTSETSLAPGADVPLTRFTNAPFSFLSFSGLNTSLRLVVRDDATWQAVWSGLYEGQSRVPPLPAVDFSKEEVLVAALGQRGSGGYSIVFGGAVGDESGGVDVVVQSRSPGKTCGTPAVITQPVDIAKIPKTAGDIRFVEHASVSDCG